MDCSGRAHQYASPDTNHLIPHCSTGFCSLPGSLAWQAATRWAEGNVHKRTLQEIQKRKRELQSTHRDLCRAMVPGRSVDKTYAKIELLEDLETILKGAESTGKMDNDRP